MIAPMEGVMDPWIREILTSFGSVDFCVTEFIRVTSHVLPDHVFYDYAPELKNNSRTSSGTPVLIQLLGSDLNYMAENAFRASEIGAYGIDINFGCPAKTVNRHDGGSVLLKNPERVFQITSAVRRAVPKHVPVNAKVRLGFEHKDFHKEIALAAQEAGAGWLTVHARTKVEGYKPPAHWDFIRNMKNAVQIPVIANGEIWNVEDYHRCREVSECEDVMIGRGFMAEPLIADRIRKDFLKNDLTKNTNNLKENTEADSQTNLFYLKHFILKYIEICPRKETKFLVGRTKQLVKLLSRQNPYFNLLFDKIKVQQKLEDIQNLIISEL